LWPKIIEVADPACGISNKLRRLPLAQIGTPRRNERPTKVSLELNPLELNKMSM
jgi:hypothetical protein